MAARLRSLNLLVMLALAPALTAQAPPKKETPKKEPAGAVLFGKEGAPVAAAAMIAHGSPMVSVMVLHHGAAIDGYWVLAPMVAERLNPEAEKHMFKDVRDRTDSTKDQFARDYLITLARRVQPADLAKAADPNISYVHLVGQSNEFRGAVVPIRGKLRMVTRFDAPLSLKRDPDVKFLYEGWIYDPGDYTGKNPYCVLFSELPKGIAPGNKLEHQVSCNAYFFKLLKYQAGDGSWHLAPMLIARTVNLLDAPVDSGETNIFRDVMLPVIVCSTFAVILVGMGLLLFFRRGDKAVNARLRQTRDAQFVVPTQDPPASPEPTEAIKPEKSEI